MVRHSKCIIIAIFFIGFLMMVFVHRFRRRHLDWLETDEMRTFYNNELLQVVKLWSILTDTNSKVILNDIQSFLSKRSSQLDSKVVEWAVSKLGPNYDHCGIAVNRVESCGGNIVVVMQTDSLSPGAWLEVTAESPSSLQKCYVRDYINGTYAAVCTKFDRLIIGIDLHYNYYLQFSMLAKPLLKRTLTINCSTVTYHSCHVNNEFKSNSNRKYVWVKDQDSSQWEYPGHILPEYREMKKLNTSRIIVIGDSHMRFYYMGILLKLGVHHDNIHPPPFGSHRCLNVSYHWATHATDVGRHLAEYLQKDLGDFRRNLGINHLFVISIAHHYLTPPNTTHAEGIVRFLTDFPALKQTLLQLKKLQNVQILWVTAPPFPDHTFRLPADPMKTPVVAVANQFIAEQLQRSGVHILDAFKIILPLSRENCRNHFLCIGGLDSEGKIIIEGRVGQVVLNEIIHELWLLI